MDKKALNLPILISLVVGNMIGTGIYVLPASLARYGNLSIVAWLLTSVAAMLLATTFANLNKQLPKTGGPYAFCKAAFGDFIGFVVAYTYWGSILVSVAGMTVAIIGYFGFLSPLLDANHPAYSRGTALALELGIVWLFTFINIIGIHIAGVTQLILTILKILPLLIISFIGIYYLKLDNYTQTTITHQSTLSTIGSAAALTFWAFIGLESATVPAENTSGYRVIFKATLYGTLMTSLIYIISSTVLMGIMPSSALKNSQFPFSDAATLIFNHNTATFITVCAIFSGLGALNGTILVQGQVAFAAARDNLFPHKFAKLSRHDVPIAAHCLSSTLISILLMLTISPSMLNQFYNIALLAAGLTLFTYLMTMLAEIKFNPFFSKATFIALLAAAYIIWMITSLDARTLITTVIILLLCLPIYHFTLKRPILS